MEEVELYLEEAKSAMQKALAHTKNELTRIRAGKAMPTMLDGLNVDYYGAPTPIAQVASINTPDARTLVIKPWEKKMIAEIEKAIINSDLGVTPQNDGEIVRINLPMLTEDRRKALVKQVRNEAEQGKIAVRNARKDANEGIRKLTKEGVSEDDVKRGEDKVQALTDDYSKKMDELADAKEKEIMTI
jgi:ribosome recycling factor